MKTLQTLQNDLTTIEQSKRLIELGVPKNSANHYYGKDGKLHYIDGTIPYSLLWETGCTPCWSVGRLIEIHTICGGASSSYYISAFPTNILNEVMWHLTEAVRHGWIDFSKLED